MCNVIEDPDVTVLIRSGHIDTVRVNVTQNKIGITLDVILF